MSKHLLVFEGDTVKEEDIAAFDKGDKAADGAVATDLSAVTADGHGQQEGVAHNVDVVGRVVLLRHVHVDPSRGGGTDGRRGWREEGRG